MPLHRWILVTIFALLAFAGASLLYAGIIARSRFEPSVVRWGDAEYAVVVHREDQALRHEFHRNGLVAETLAGSTDTLCDDPWIMLIDVDGDSRLDVYHRTCRGHGYLRYEPAASLTSTSASSISTTRRSCGRCGPARSWTGTVCV
jgi:hypothetical protein